MDKRHCYSCGFGILSTIDCDPNNMEVYWCPDCECWGFYFHTAGFDGCDNCAKIGVIEPFKNIESGPDDLEILMCMACGCYDAYWTTRATLNHEHPLGMVDGEYQLTDQSKKYWFDV